MKRMARFFDPKKLDWHKGYWSGVLVGVGFIMNTGGMTAMSYRIVLDPGLIMFTGSFVFIIGLFVAHRTMKSAGENCHERQ